MSEEQIKALGIDVDRCYKHDFAYENGNYLNSCIQCRHKFIGHKRRVICFKCQLRPEAQPIFGRNRPN